MIQESEVILLHGGDSDVLEALQSGSDLYGWVDENNPQFSGNLTDSEFVASQFALRRCGPDASPIIFEFKLPKVGIIFYRVPFQSLIGFERL